MYSVQIGCRDWGRLFVQAFASDADCEGQLIISDGQRHDQLTSVECRAENERYCMISVQRYTDAAFDVHEEHDEREHDWQKKQDDLGLVSLAWPGPRLGKGKCAAHVVVRVPVSQDWRQCAQ